MLTNTSSAIMPFVYTRHMRSIALLILFGFILATVFGFAVFGHEMSNSSTGCVVSFMDGTPCPTSILNFVLHHVSGLQMFTVVLPLPLLLLTLLSVLFLVLQHGLDPYERYRPRSPQHTQYLAFNIRPKQDDIFSWLTLLETSPTPQFGAR